MQNMLINLARFYRLSRGMRKPLRRISEQPQLTPNYIDALLDLGGLLQEARRFDEAATIFQRVVDLEPDHCNGWLSVGAALLGSRRYAESLAAFRRALSHSARFGGWLLQHVVGAFGFGSHRRSDRGLPAKPSLSSRDQRCATFNMGTMLLSLRKLSGGVACVQLSLCDARRKVAARGGARGSLDGRAAEWKVHPSYWGAGIWRRNSVFALPPGAQQSRCTK